MNNINEITIQQKVGISNLKVNYLKNLILRKLLLPCQ